MTYVAWFRICDSVLRDMILKLKLGTPWTSVMANRAIFLHNLSGSTVSSDAALFLMVVLDYR